MERPVMWLVAAAVLWVAAPAAAQSAGEGADGRDTDGSSTSAIESRRSATETEEGEGETAADQDPPIESRRSATETDAGESTAPPAHDPTLLYIGITTASIGVVTFGILAASAVAERGRVSAGCGGMCSDGDRSAADGLGIAANVGAGVALVGAVLSLIGIAVMGRPEDDEPREREEEISVAFGPSGVVVSGTF